MDWFFKLPGEIQVALVLQACGLIFGCGVWWATVRALKQAVIEIKREVATMRADHEEKLELHGERLARLETRGLRGGR